MIPLTSELNYFITNLCEVETLFFFFSSCDFMAFFYVELTNESDVALRNSFLF